MVEGSAASVQGGALELVPAATGRHSSFTLPPQRLDQGYDVAFRYRVTASGTPADGLALHFGAPNATRIPIDGIGRFPRGLSVEWATFSQPGYHVRVDGVEVRGGHVASGAIPNGAVHDAHVRWNPIEGLTFGVDSVPIFADRATPGFAPTSEDMLGFSALNIGLSERVRVDDVAVALPEPSARAGLLVGGSRLLGVRRRSRPDERFRPGR